MGIATGVQTKVIIGKEATWGSAATDANGRTYRRVSADVNLVKQTFRSNEIRADHQGGKTRHGGITVEGTISGELSCGTWEEPFAGLLRGTWTAGVTTGAVATIAADQGDRTFTRSIGSFVSDGFKVGDLINVSGFTEAANNGRHLVSAVSATVLTTTTTTLVDEVEGDTVTILVPGKKLMIPASGHTDDSFTIEKLYEMGATDVSELSVGCKFGSCSIGVTPDGMVTVEFSVLGKDMDSDSVAYFQSPAAETSTEGMAGPQGALLVGGNAIATVTGFTIDIDGQLEAAAVVGSQYTPAIFQGVIGVSGSLDVYFENDDLWQQYKSETDISAVLNLTAPSGDAFLIKIPAITMTGNTKTDTATGGTIATIPFEASRYLGNGNLESSTVVFIDSTLS